MKDLMGQTLEIGDKVFVASSNASSRPYLAKIVGFSKVDVKIVELLPNGNYSTREARKSLNYLIAYTSLK